MNYPTAKKVRLTEQEMVSIQQVFKKYFAANDALWVFGSRADLTKKGGDIDLYVETSALEIEKTTKMKIGFLVDLKQKIGEQKIDLIINIVSSSEKLPIYDEAKATGVQLV